MGENTQKRKKRGLYHQPTAGRREIKREKRNEKRRERWGKKGEHGRRKKEEEPETQVVRVVRHCNSNEQKRGMLIKYRLRCIRDRNACIIVTLPLSV